jgi:cytochrome P450
MKYTEMCIKETLRLYPSVPWISRDVYEDFHLGITIYEDTILPKSIFSSHTT